MLWDSFDWGNPEVATIQDTVVNGLMADVIDGGFTPVNPLCIVKYFSGISNAWDKAGGTVTVAYIRKDGNVRVKEAYILPESLPAKGFVTQGSGVTAASVPWVVWLEPPKDGETTIIWSSGAGTCLRMENGVCGMFDATSVRVSFTHEVTAWDVHGVRYRLENGKVTKPVKFEFPEPQTPSAKKKNKRHEDVFDYTPPDVIVESPFAALLKRGKK